MIENEKNKKIFRHLLGFYMSMLLYQREQAQN